MASADSALPTTRLRPTLELSKGVAPRAAVLRMGGLRVGVRGLMVGVRGLSDEERGVKVGGGWVRVGNDVGVSGLGKSALCRLGMKEAKLYGFAMSISVVMVGGFVGVAGLRGATGCGGDGVSSRGEEG